MNEYFPNKHPFIVASIESIILTFLYVNSSGNQLGDAILFIWVYTIFVFLIYLVVNLIATFLYNYGKRLRIESKSHSSSLSVIAFSIILLSLVSLLAYLHYETLIANKSLYTDSIDLAQVFTNTFEELSTVGVLILYFTVGYFQKKP